MKVFLVILLVSSTAAADPDVDLHGFASEGGFLSTANDFIGESSRGSLQFFQAGINVSTEPADRLRFGLQLFSRNEGKFDDATPKVDWAFGDYQWKPWLGIRAGIVKMPFGLYNEYLDAEAAHVPILLPQSLYATRNRSVLLSQTGFELYGNQPIGGAGELDYQAWYGTLTIPEDALTLQGASLDRVDTRYVTGAQVFWTPPVDGLRVGATILRAYIDFDLTLDPATLQALIAAGRLPPTSEGKLSIALSPVTFGVGSVEYTRGDWMLAAEYGRALTHQRSNVPMLITAADHDEESFYGLVSRRVNDHVAASAYYSVEDDANDRGGRGMMYAKPFRSWQRDAAATLELDVNDHWLWKAEGHFVDGAAELDTVANPDPKRFWGMFLVRSTVYF